jgi:hypothetical protein
VLFPDWETFYVIVGSAAGALTGLMFVVIALLANTGGSARQIHTFATPTVVHFGAALLLSTTLAAPWPGTGGLRVALVVYGAAGVVYTVVVLRWARRQDQYAPVFEDWMFHTVLPFAAYAGVLVGAAALTGPTTDMLFVIGGAAVLLLFIGVHNAWDAVTFFITRGTPGAVASAPAADPVADPMAGPVDGPVHGPVDGAEAQIGTESPPTVR